MKRILGWIVRAVLLAGLLVFTVLLAWAFESQSMPALRFWHPASLSAEFTARDATPESALQDYLEREERLFRELREKVYDRVEPTDDLIFSRYRAGGPQDPEIDRLISAARKMLRESPEFQAFLKRTRGRSK